MCKFLKKIFGKKDDEPMTGGGIISGSVSYEENVPEIDVITGTISHEESGQTSEETAPEVNQTGATSESAQTEPIQTVTPEKPNNDTKTFVVLLDNGHAKSTAGKRSPKFEDGRQFFEYEFNRDVVSRIAEKLWKLGIKYQVLVPEVNEDVALSERARRANAFCDEYGTDNCMFISVHSNAYGMGEKWESPGKWSVWTTKGKTRSDEYAKIMYGAAEDILKPYGFGCRDGKVQGNGNDGPDYEENFTVIYKTKCPAILTENLFYTNKKECEWLMTDEGRQAIADLHVEGIQRIMKTR